MRPDCKESREPWHCTMMYDEEGQNVEYEALWDKHVARTQYSLKTIDFIVGPQGAAAAVQLPKQLEQWYQIPEAAPHVSLLIGQGFESKELGPMVKEASKVKQWTQVGVATHGTKVEKEELRQVEPGDYVATKKGLKGIGTRPRLVQLAHSEEDTDPEDVEQSEAPAYNTRERNKKKLQQRIEPQT
ncbi:hypothetical protein QTP86_021140, partial [Hemibagrus guttatus]